MYKTPHKHAELIKAWADGAEIELRTVKWEPCPYPSWSPNTEYRIKPEPKPDYRVPLRLLRLEMGGFILGSSGKDNFVATFDGETGKLKKVEMIDE